jgi:chromosome segregation ATPase
MKNGTMPESQEESTNPFPSMQAELHKKGAVLTKAWADLFSYLTRYQADLMVKENAMDIAEKEIDMRRKQLEDIKSVTLDSEEFGKLQDDMHTKERILLKLQSEHCVTETQLRQVQSDLTNHMELLERSRSELLEKHADLIRYRGDVERLKSELTIKEEHIQVKDNLLKKLQSQLMRENAELKEEAELERRALLLERRAHEITRRALKEKTQQVRSSFL